MPIVFTKKRRNRQRRNVKGETALVNACMEYLTLKGYLPLRVNSGLLIVEHSSGKQRAVRLAPTGTSDIIACSHDGRFIAVECKMAGRDLTPNQKEFLEEIKKRGGEALVVNSLDDLDSYFQRKKKNSE